MVKLSKRSWNKAVHVEHHSAVILYHLRRPRSILSHSRPRSGHFLPSGTSLSFAVIDCPAAYLWMGPSFGCMATAVLPIGEVSAFHSILQLSAVCFGKTQHSLSAYYSSFYLFLGIILRFLVITDCFSFLPRWTRLSSGDSSGVNAGLFGV